ncbi:MAG: hypothetical protein CMB81_04165 [Flammeovirgaceae bacterium]|nr:hypothetical protein [Flammeovirgaceae bacterium]|tara:strand:+ start:62 stop:550 length:489 start_codon:yes stop_codon:yes gene_type:complete
MINLKKAFILSFSILLPIILYFFLRFFGDNKYVVSEVNYECDEVLLSALYKQDKESEIILVDIRFNLKNSLVDNLLTKLYSNKKIDIITLSEIDRNLNWTVLKTDFFNETNDIICFKSDIKSDYVLLLDNENKVRGIYDLNELDEYDRLNVEIDIINLKNEK